MRGMSGSKMSVWRAVAVFALGGMLGLADGCGSRPAQHKDTQTGHGAAAGSNVLLLTLDTTRADHLGCYGQQNAATPTLDALAQHGVCFERALAAAGITLPSHTTLLTGTLPPEHGVHGNLRNGLGPELATLAEVFQQHGYRTGAFVSANVLSARYGLARGFDAYSADMPNYRRAAGDVVDEALPWLQGTDQPFFAWLHFYDAHWPYQTPPEFATKTGQNYEGAIAYVDVQLARLMDWLRTSGRLDNTLIVATADHGEALGQHGYQWHALYDYDSILRVPLIVSLPARLPQGLRPTCVVGLTDVMPTILDLLGWDSPASVTGKSFLPALRGQEASSHAVYAESDFGYESFGTAKLRCLVEGDWKYIRAPRVELYDRGSDPEELQNLASQQPARVADMEARLSAWEQRMQRHEPMAVTEKAADLKALQALGYVGGPVAARAPDAPPVDPKDVVKLANDLPVAEALFGAHRPYEAIRLLEPAVRQSPGTFAARELLGKAYAAVDLLALGQLTLQDALAIYGESASTWQSLAIVLNARGALQRAVEACEQSLKLDPEDPTSRALMPNLKEKLAEQQARVRELRERFAADPASADVARTLAQELAVSGKIGDAIRVLKAALEKNRQQPELANDLAWYLATTVNDALRDPPAALKWAQIAASGEFAGNPQVLDTLAAAHAANGDFDGARATMRRALNQAEKSDDRSLPIKLKRRLEYYEAKRPYRAPE